MSLVPVTIFSPFTSAETTFLQGFAGLSYQQGDIFYINGSGQVARLAIGTAGQALVTNAGATAPEWATPAGGGDVVKVGTPADNQIGVWTGNGTIEGDTALTFDTATNTLVIASGVLTVDTLTLTGTGTLNGVDAIDATTEATIEAAIDTLANLTSIQGFTVTLADAGANTFFGWDDTAGAYENLTAAEAEAIIEPLIDTLANLTSIQGLTITLADAGADAIFGWDDSASAYQNLSAADARTALGLIAGGSGDIWVEKAGDSMTGQLVISVGSAATTEMLRLVNTTDNASVQVAQFEGDRATMADNDEAYISLLLSNDAGTQTEFARITWVATDVNAGTSVDGRIDFAVVTAGSLADEMQLDGTALSPSTSDGLALGTTTLMWADLFLASGAVVNFNNGDVLITHSANTLTFSGASSGYLYDAVNAPSSNDAAALGTTTLMWSDLFLASGAVINFNNGDVTITHSSNVLAFAGASTNYTFDAAVAPATNDGAALGTSSLAWADLYLATGGNILVNNANAKRTLILSAAGGAPTTTIGCGGPTKVEAGTNDIDYYALEFDTTTEERAFWNVQMPDNYDGSTVTARFIWTNAGGSSTQTVDWGIKARAFADDAAIDQAYGTEITTTDTWLAQGDVHISAASSAITIGGSPAGGQWVVFNVGRKVATDNMSGDARLLAVQIEYGINAYSD